MHNTILFNTGIDITATGNPSGFIYGEGVFGPDVENRRLDDIRHSLMNPECDGPAIVYSIAMDVGKTIHKEFLLEQNLLFGIVAYATGRLGMEPVRSQGHIHKVSEYSGGWSTPEVYEIWAGEAIIYIQEHAADNPGRCYAVYAGSGEVVVVPPCRVHATISANPDKPLVFGAWCNRDYGFEYDEIRERNGIAWFPIYKKNNELEWVRNTNYCHSSQLIRKHPETYRELGIEKGKSIYKTFEDNPDAFLYVSRPGLKEHVWRNFSP